MNIIESDDNFVKVELYDDDIRLILSSINEALEALDEWEFPIRTGFNIEEVEAFRDQLKSARLSSQNESG